MSIRTSFVIVLCLCQAALYAAIGPAAAQEAPAALPDATVPASPAPGAEPAVQQSTGTQRLDLIARFSESGPVIESGVWWRVFRVNADNAGQMPMVGESQDREPVFMLPPGVYVVHAAYGLAAATRRVELGSVPATETLVLNAGALKVSATINGAPLPTDQLTSRIQAILANGDRRLIAEDVEAAEITRLPEGRYYVECVYGQSNAVVSGEIEIKAGQLSEASFRHRAATLTMKLVSQEGGEALANTSWSILTPGGDVIRESIGAFPSMVLAEGEYTVVARHEGRVFQREFEVKTGQDQDIEVLAQVGATQ